jgi:predicted transporter
MNHPSFWFLGGLAAVAIITYAYCRIAGPARAESLEATISWLLKITFYDFVKLVIFIKPLKKHTQLVGVIIWLILLLVVGRYIIFTRPKLAEISGPNIPMIGYVYLVSLFFMGYFALRLSRKTT